VKSLPPDQAMAAMDRQQALLRQTVDSRVQGILTPEQATALQRVLSRYAAGPKGR
jgi:Spy/CpxP family protein refolding chaperone